MALDSIIIIILPGHGARAQSRDPPASDGSCPKTKEREVVHWVRTMMVTQVQPPSRSISSAATFNRDSGGYTRYNAHTIDPSYVRRCQAHKTTQKRERHRSQGCCTLTSRRVRADKSALYSIEISALFPVDRPTLERYEYFLATEEDIVVRSVFALGHLIISFLIRPGTTHTQILFL